MPTKTAPRSALGARVENEIGIPIGEKRTVTTWVMPSGLVAGMSLSLGNWGILVPANHL